METVMCSWRFLLYNTRRIHYSLTRCSFRPPQSCRCWHLVFNLLKFSTHHFVKPAAFYSLHPIRDPGADLQDTERNCPFPSSNQGQILLFSSLSAHWRFMILFWTYSGGMNSPLKSGQQFTVLLAFIWEPINLHGLNCELGSVPAPREIVVVENE